MYVLSFRAIMSKERRNKRLGMGRREAEENPNVRKGRGSKKKGMLSCMKAFRFIIPQEEDELANSLSRVLTRGRHFPSHSSCFRRFALTFKTRSSDVVNPGLCSRRHQSWCYAAWIHGDSGTFHMHPFIFSTIVDTPSIFIK